MRGNKLLPEQAQEGELKLQTSFSTDDVHPRDRITYIKDVACKTYVELEFQTKQKNYSSNIRAGEISNISLSQVTTDQCEVTRTKDNIKSSKSDDLLLSIQIKGATTLHQDGRTAILTPGEFALYDTQRNYHLSLTGNNEQLVLKIPRAKLTTKLGETSRFTAQQMSSKNPISKCALAYILTLPTLSDTLEKQKAELISNQAIDLLSDAISHECPQTNQILSHSKFATLMRLKSVINTHLSNPDFKPSEAAARVGITIRYANKLLSSEDTSLEKYIYTQRLIRSRENLNNPNFKSHTISEIAHLNGFTSSSHFTRRFKETYEITPKAYRNKNR